MENALMEATMILRSFSESSDFDPDGEQEEERSGFIELDPLQWLHVRSNGSPESSPAIPSISRRTHEQPEPFAIWREGDMTSARLRVDRIAPKWKIGELWWEIGSGFWNKKTKRKEQP